ncbi:Ref family recombination enhancement nuclease [Enterobacter hormaechei]|uniref:Ref family recombination enhancement nuclease n=1 Tax=Enterobacter hormaechei TaxID=158836 RepID=UPI003F42E1BC
MKLKLADPAWLAQQQEKKRAAADRALKKHREKIASPEYRDKCREKLHKAREKAREKASIQTQAMSSPRRSPSRGLKGRSPTAEEKRYQEAIAKLPCAACALHGVYSPVIVLHHIDGRTAPDAHKKVLPLCNWHHQYAAPVEIRHKHPWLVPVHADGITGGKSEFTRLNASEAALLAIVYDKCNFLT